MFYVLRPFHPPSTSFEHLLRARHSSSSAPGRQKPSVTPESLVLLKEVHGDVFWGKKMSFPLEACAPCLPYRRRPLALGGLDTLLGLILRIFPTHVREPASRSAHLPPCCPQTKPSATDSPAGVWWESGWDSPVPFAQRAPSTDWHVAYEAQMNGALMSRWCSFQKLGNGKVHPKPAA